MTVFNAIFIHCNNISTHILTKRMTKTGGVSSGIKEISTHILTKRMTAILNKTFSFKIKLYIHYNILFAIFYIYNSILYPFSSQKCSYSGANDSANYCSLAFRTPRFPGPSLQRMHSVPFFRFRDSLLTSTFIGQTRKHLSQ